MKRLALFLIPILAASSVAAACAMPWAAPVPAPLVAQPATQPAPKPISVEGTVQPLAHAKLSFQNTGRVRSVIEVGALVQTGDIIARLDAAELDLALQAAIDELVLARAQEAQAQELQTREGALPEQVAASGAAVRAAQSKLDEVLTGPRDAERRAADAAVEQAAARYQDALAKHEALTAQPKAADVEAAAAALEKAELDAESAAARLAQLERGGTPEDVTQAHGSVTRAQADLVTAEASLAQLLNGPAAADVIAAQAQLDQARTRLAQIIDAPRTTTQDLANAQLAVEASRASLDKSRADAGDGNLVGTGKPLSRQAADAAIRGAELQVQQAQNSLDKLRAAGPTEWDVRLAQQVVTSAQAGLDRVTRPPTREELAKGGAQVNGARAALESTQAKLQQVERGATQADLVSARGAAMAAQAGVSASHARLQQVLAGPTDEEKRAAASAVEAAAWEMRAAGAKRDQLLAGATRAEQEQARSALASAAGAEAQTRRGATEASVQVAVARTRRAGTAVEQARAALDRVTLRAPLAGTVTNVSVREGEVITSGTIAATVADLSRLQIETRDLDETAIARVKDGQDVTIAVSALGRASMPGRVLRIARQPQATIATNTSDVYYTATIALPQPHPDLRWGMTVRVEIK